MDAAGMLLPHAVGKACNRAIKEGLKAAASRILVRCGSVVGPSGRRLIIHTSARRRALAHLRRHDGQQASRTTA